MIKDISIIRKELDGYEEIVLPFDFIKGCSVKYITLKKKNKEEEESFYPGGEFISMGNDCIILKKGHRTWQVPCCKRNKDGSIRYSTRFFIKSEEEEKCDEKVKELNDVVKYQQNIIDTLSEKLKELELIKYQIMEEKQNYEDLLQQNRFNLKELSIQSREKDEKIKKYEDIIKKLANSHQMFQSNA